MTYEAKRRGMAVAFSLPLLAILIFFEILPLLAVALDGFVAQGAWSLSNYKELLSSSFQRNAFTTSIYLSLATALIGVVVSMPLAATLKRMPSSLRRSVLTYANIGANFTGFPIAFAFIIMFGFSGMVTLLLARMGVVTKLNIYSMGGLVLVYCYFQIQFGLLLLYPAMDIVTQDLREAASLLGASALSFWRKVGLPLLAPALIGTFVLLFANAMGTYATAYALVGGNANLVTIRIGELIAGDVFTDPHQADALATLLVGSLLALVGVEQLFMRRFRRHE